MNKYAVWQCLALLIISLCSLSFTVARRDDKVNDYLQDLTDRLNLGAVQFSVQNAASGKITTYLYGNITNKSILRFGSITKIFNSDVVFDLFDLDDHPGRYDFPDYVYAGSERITVKELLSMTSGVHEYTFNIGYNATTNELIPANYSALINVNLGWKDVPLDFTPATRFCYCNTGFSIFSVMIQRVTGISLAQHIKNKWQYIAPTIKLHDGTTPNSAWPQTPGYIPWFYPTYLAYGAGDLIGTGEDLLKAFSHILTKKKDMEKRVQWQFKPFYKIDGEDAPCAHVQAGDEYGMAWQRYNKINGSPGYGHDGTYVVRSLLIDHPESNNRYLLHIAAPMDNKPLVKHMSNLVGLYTENKVKYLE